MLRIRCDAKAAQCPLGDKFGCDPELEAPELIQLAKTLGLNVSLAENCKQCSVSQIYNIYSAHSTVYCVSKYSRWLELASMLVPAAWIHRSMPKLFIQRANSSILPNWLASSLIFLILAAVFRAIRALLSKRYLWHNLGHAQQKIETKRTLVIRSFELWCDYWLIGRAKEKKFNFFHPTQIAAIISQSLDFHFPSTNVRVIAEPGRYYVSSAYTLACYVHSKRDIRRDGKLKNTMYFLNDGVYGSFNCQLYDHKIVYPLTLKPSTEGSAEHCHWIQLFASAFYWSAIIVFFSSVTQQNSRVHCGVLRAMLSIA